MKRAKAISAQIVGDDKLVKSNCLLNAEISIATIPVDSSIIKVIRNIPMSSFTDAGKSEVKRYEFLATDVSRSLVFFGCDSDNDIAYSVMDAVSTERLRTHFSIYEVGLAADKLGILPPDGMQKLRGITGLRAFLLPFSLSEGMVDGMVGEIYDTIKNLKYGSEAWKKTAIDRAILWGIANDKAKLQLSVWDALESPEEGEDIFSEDLSTASVSPMFLSIKHGIRVEAQASNPIEHPSREKAGVYPNPFLVSNLPEGSDVENWCVVRHPAQGEGLIDVSNRHAIEEVRMNSYIEDNTAVITSGYIMVKVDDRDESDEKLFGKKPKKNFSPTEAFSEIDRIASELENYPVLDQEDYDARINQNLLDRINRNFSNIVRHDAPEDWTSQVLGYLSSKNLLSEFGEGESDNDDEYIAEAMVALRLIDPEYLTDENAELLTREEAQLAAEMARAVDESNAKLERYVKMVRVESPQLKALQQQVQESIKKLNNERIELVLRGVGRTPRPDVNQTKFPFMKQKHFVENPKDPATTAVEQWKDLAEYRRRMVAHRNRMEAITEEIERQEQELRAVVSDLLASDYDAGNEDIFDLTEASSKIRHVCS